MNARCDLSRREDLSIFDSPFLRPRVMVDVELTSDEPAVLPAASRRSDRQGTCKVSRPCEALCGSEELKIVKTTSCSTCTGKVSPTCEYACANEGCF